MTRFSLETERVLRAAGWYPGRRVDVSEWKRLLAAGGVHMHAAAEEFLREFGGLYVSSEGPGVTSGREPFEIDPALCADSEEDRFLAWGEEIGRPVFPLGELDDGRFCLGIDEYGEIYLVETWLASFGRGDEAMEKLVLGYMPRTVA
jgi:hypothetical protein